MNVKRSFLFFLVIALVMGIGACQRQATPPPESPVPEGPTQPPGDVTGEPELYDELILLATQTFIAQLTSVAPPVEETQPPLDQGTVIPTPMPTEPQPAEPMASPTVAPPIGEIPPIVVPASYTLQTGEFPYCIARRFNVDPGQLLRMNSMSSASIYYAGMTLQIPQSGSPFPGNRSLHPHPSTYTVRSGDTLSKIACYFGDVSPEQIAAANRLTPPYNITAGQILNIP